MNNAQQRLRDAPPVVARFWEAVRRLPRYLRLAARLARDPRVPRPAKAALLVGGVYTVSPIDLVPGIIPVAGQLDDVVVLLLALRQAIRLCPEGVAAEHLGRAGLGVQDIDDDLRATRNLAIWLAARGMRFVGNAVRRGSRTVWTTVRGRG